MTDHAGNRADPSMGGGGEISPCEDIKVVLELRCKYRLMAEADGRFSAVNLRHVQLVARLSGLDSI
jgi:hypothetical protein